MIDTDKYEGHTEGEWEWWNDYIRDTSENELHIAKMEYDYKSADAQLIADAPLLLAEVKRLYAEPRMTIDEWNTKPEGPCVTVYMDGCEYVGCLRLYKNEDGEVIE